MMRSTSPGAGGADEDDLSGVHGVPDVVRRPARPEERLDRVGGGQPLDDVRDDWDGFLAVAREDVLPEVPDVLGQVPQHVGPPDGVREDRADLEDGGRQVGPARAADLPRQVHQGLDRAREDGLRTAGRVGPVQGRGEAGDDVLDDVGDLGLATALHRQRVPGADHLVELGAREVDLPNPVGQFLVRQVRSGTGPAVTMGIKEEDAEPAVGDRDRLHERHLGLSEA